MTPWPGIEGNYLKELIDQVEMMDIDGNPKSFLDLQVRDKDLTTFTIENLFLLKRGKLVDMRIVLKRKITTELMTTFLPTILLLLITFTTILFEKDLFGDALAVNLTIMLVMTTIFTSKIEELPPTSDTKMIDIWLIGCLLVPFTEVVLRTIIEVFANCDQCKEKGGIPDYDDRGGEKREAWKDISSTSKPFHLGQVLVGVGTKVTPEKVKHETISQSLEDALSKDCCTDSSQQIGQIER